MDQLELLVEQIHDQESFFAFVRALIADWNDEQIRAKLNPSSPYGPGANGWENGSIGSYLDAALRCAEAWRGRNDETTGHPLGMGEEASWKGFAWFLLMGKYYE